MQEPIEKDRRESGLVNHPTQEQWMAFLYREAPRVERSALRSHLSVCATCRANVTEWQSAMSGLASWKMSPVKPLAIARAWPAALKWGMAALFALGLGYGLGRFSAPGRSLDRQGMSAAIPPADPQSEAFREEVRRQVQIALASFERDWAEQVEKRLDQKTSAQAAGTLAAAKEHAAGLLAAYDTERQQERDAILSALARIDARQTRHAADLAAFRTETERMAVLTEASFRRAQQQMVRLANFTESMPPNEAPSFNKSPQ